MPDPSDETRQRVLEIAGNPHNGRVEQMVSMPDAYRIVTRTYAYNHVTKRGGCKKKTVGVVLGDTYFTIDEFHAKYTRRGHLRPAPPPQTPTPKPADGAPANPNAEDALDFICKKNLSALPIFYEAASSVGLVEDLNAVYGKGVAAQILSVAMHWIHEEHQDNGFARRYSRYTHYKRFSEIFALPHPGSPAEKELIAFFESLGRDSQASLQLMAKRCARSSSRSRMCYDLTSLPNIPGEMKYGDTAKSGAIDFKPLTHMALLVDQQTKLPISYHQYRGKLPDCSTAEGLIAIIDSLNLEPDVEFTFIFDRGYETEENLALCSKAGKRCLMAAGTLMPNIVSESIEKRSDFWDAPSIPPGTDVLGRTDKIVRDYRGTQYACWAHTIRDGKKSSLEHAAFMRGLESFEQQWSASSPEGRAMLSHSSLMQFFDSCRFGQKKPVRCAAAIDEHCRHLGFFAILSNYECTTIEALQDYRRRDCVEKCLIDCATPDINVGSARHRHAAEGRLVVAFAALIILSELNNRFSKEINFKDKRRNSIAPHTYNVRDALEIARGMEILYNTKTKSSRIIGKTEELLRLCEACGMPDLYEETPKYIASIEDLSMPA